MKPTPLTDAEICEALNIDRSDDWAFTVAEAIESARDEQWIKMLGDDEPVAWMADSGTCVKPDERMNETYYHIPLFIHPAPQPTTEPVGYISGTYAGRFIFEPLNPAQVLPDRTALYLHPATDHTACHHRIADARNPVVKSGYICVDCGALFSAADHTDHTALLRQASDALNALIGMIDAGGATLGSMHDARIASAAIKEALK